MEGCQLVHQITCDLEGKEYLIEVFHRPDGKHFARTIFDPKDVIISDGPSLEEALAKHRGLLRITSYNVCYTKLLRGPSLGEERVVRGGSWYLNSAFTRSAGRLRVEPDFLNNDVGIRVCAAEDQIDAK